MISTYIEKHTASRNTILDKLIELGLAQSGDKLETLAAAIEDIVSHGAVSVTIKEGDTYTIEPGYHTGGTVSAVAGGGNYTLQAKSVTPTKKQQTIAPDSGYYGLSGVTVAAIPSAYQDVTGVTAAAGDVLTGKIIVLADGTVRAGEMANNGAVSKTLDATTITYTIPKGYHSGSGKVEIVLETKSVTPTKSAQNITPTAGKVLGKVTVAAIPDQYQDVTPVTTKAANVLDGDIFVDATGAAVEGAMPNNGEISYSIDGMTSTSVSIPAGYTSGGTIFLTDDIENALAAI